MFMKRALLMHMTLLIENNIKVFKLGHTDLGFKVKKSRVTDSNAPPMSFHPVMLNAVCHMAQCSRPCHKVAAHTTLYLVKKAGNVPILSSACFTAAKRQPDTHLGCLQLVE